MNGTRDRRLSDLAYGVATLPLSLSSWVFYRICRRLLRLATERFVRRNPAVRESWQPLSEAFLDRPGALPVMMTTGPRWNPHAFIGTVGPLEIQAEFEIDIAVAARSAREWFFVVYRAPGRETVGALSVLDGRSHGPASFKVPGPGRYAIAARYYHPSPRSVLPAIRVDGRDRVAATELDPELNGFYRNLGARSGLLYGCLAWYVYPMLRCSGWLPTRWVEREFLPVGNPETEFRYGWIRRGERLKFNPGNGIGENHDIYMTYYSRNSFPVAFSQLPTTGDMVAPPAPCTGFYLVRIQPTLRTASNPRSSGQIDVRVTRISADEPSATPASGSVRS